MTAPTVIGRGGAPQSTAASTWTFTPAVTGTPAEKDKVIVVFSSDNLPTISVDATTPEYSARNFGATGVGQGDATGGIFVARVGAGGTIPSLKVNSTSSNKMAYRAWLVRGDGVNELTIEVAVALGAGTNANPANLNLGGGVARDVLGLAAWTGDGANFPSAGPASHSNFTLTSTTAGSSTAVATAEITLAAVTAYDPANFTHVAEGWRTFTIGVWCAPALAFTDISEGRVFQRIGGVADIVLTGNYSGDTAPATIQARVMQGATQILGWTTLTSVTITNFTFTGTLAAVPEGGGYTVEVRSRDATPTVLMTLSGFAEWGVGKQLLVWGSSTPHHMFTDIDAVAPSAANMMSHLRSGAWSRFVPSGGGGDYVGTGAISIANELLAHEPNIPVGFIDRGAAGTMLRSTGSLGWTYTTDTLHINMIAEVVSQGGKVEAGIVHVISNDARNELITDVATWQGYYEDMIDHVRTDLGQPNLPIFIVSSQRAPLEPSGSNNRWTWARAVEHNIAMTYPDCYLGSVNEMFPLIVGEDVHPTPESFSTMGRFVGNSMNVNLYGLSGPYMGPDMEDASMTYDTVTGIGLITLASANGGTGGVGLTGPTGLTGFEFSVDNFATLLTPLTDPFFISPLVIQVGLATGLTLANLKWRYGAGRIPDNTNYIGNNAPAP